MRSSKLSLKWLEVFQLAARHGSIKAAAQETGLSLSTVSHHLRCLEDAVGLGLIDHTTRPMVLTSHGTVFLPYVESALGMLDRGQVAIHSNKAGDIRSLRLGLIEDFDSYIAPELIRRLAVSMPNCEFSLLTRPSHEIVDLIGNRGLDIGVATQPISDIKGAREFPLFRDPFVLAVPVDSDLDAEDFLQGRSPLPFLRYSSAQFLGAQIEIQLRRMGCRLDKRFEFESNQSLMGLVAEKNGWAITTPTNYVRALRFQPRIALRAIPAHNFARTISIYTPHQHNRDVVQSIQTTLQRLVHSYLIDPTIAQMPWLKTSFRLLERDSGSE